MLTISDLVQAITKRLEQQAKDHPDAPIGIRFDAPDSLIDDGGGYGDISRDERPEFVKRDEAGWRRIASFRR